MLHHNDIRIDIDALLQRIHQDCTTFNDEGVLVGECRHKPILDTICSALERSEYCRIKGIMFSLALLMSREEEANNILFRWMTFIFTAGMQYHAEGGKLIGDSAPTDTELKELRKITGLE